MHLLALRTAAARLLLGLARTDELVDAAHAALDAGVYSRSLGEVATFRNPTWADIGPLFEAATRELGVSLASQDEALLVLAESHLVPLAEGGTAPEDAAWGIHADFMAFSGGRRRWGQAGVFGPLGEFAYDCYAYGERRAVADYYPPTPPAEPPTVADLDAELVARARRWCRGRWGPAFDPAWRSETAVALARGIDAEGAFDRLPILADALQDAGCEDEAVLGHCRGDGPHRTGCWVVDLLLCKE